MSERLIIFIARAVARLSWGRALAFGRFLGWVYGSVIRYHRKDALDALRAAFPDRSEDHVRAIVRRMYENLGMNIVECLRLLGGDPTVYDRVHIHDRDMQAMDDVLAEGKGVLILMAHVGNWELMSTWTARVGHPGSIIVKALKSKALDGVWDAMRRTMKLKTLPTKNAYRDCLKALKKNEMVGLVLDQNMTRNEGMFVEFFGRPACTSPGLAYLAAQSGAKVLPLFHLRNPDGTHESLTLPALDPPADREEATIRAATQQYTKAIEGVIRDYPDQWIWIHRRWRTVQLAQVEPVSDDEVDA